MSYYIIELNKTDNNFNFDNIIIGRKIEGTDIAKYYIYYYDMEPKEIYLRLPRIRLIYNMDNYKYNQLKIPLYPNWDKLNNSIEFIKSFEQTIIECFKTKKINKELCSLISKKNNLNFIKASISENIKSTITDNNMKINGEIEIILKLSYIWTNETMIGLSSQLYQIKYHAPPENIDMFQDKKSNTIICNEVRISDTPIVGNKSQPIKMIPSVTDLMNAMKNLKKRE